MTKNPILNALAAFIYISLISTFMFYGTQHIGNSKSVIIPITFISLFTLSAAVMGYIFLYQPLQLYFDNKKKHALDLFLKTVLIFATIIIILLIILFSGSIQKINGI